MNAKFLGGILLIAGTSIGGGMLALPIANATSGFWSSSLIMFFCWAITTLSAFFILEVSLYLPPGRHLVSMAESTLGRTGLLVTWTTFLLLLYTLLCAYISGGADVLRAVASHAHLSLAPWQAIILFTVVFGSIVCGGIRQVDMCNRLLMFGKLGVYLVLVVLIAPRVKLPNLQGGSIINAPETLMILITAFGFAIIVPNLREYFKDNISQLKHVVFIGSLIPLICYIVWDAIIMGSVGTHDNQNLHALLQSSQPTSGLAQIVADTIHSSIINSLFNLFLAICMLTAFLGVSLCLMSFLTDGLNLHKQSSKNPTLFLITFLPPVGIVLGFPGAYLYALNYAGFGCIILLLLLPALMAYFGRKKFKSDFTVPGKKWSIFSVIFAAAALFMSGLYYL